MYVLRDYQEKAVADTRAAFANGYNAPCLVLSTGAGKCFAKGTPIMLFDGSIKSVENIRVGDLLMGYDSKPRTVKSICTGIEQMYDIVPVKGEKYTVNESHILSLKITGENTCVSCGGKTYRGGDVVNITVKDSLSSTKNFKHIAKGWRTGVSFPEQQLPLPPYLLGVWLGDGNSRNQGITNCDKEIIKEIYDYAKSVGNYVRVSENITYYIHRGASPKVKNVFLDGLKSLNLLQNKHIPKIYLQNSRKNRLELLAGLIDSDGYVSNNGCDYVTKSKRLAEDIAYLCRSLGLAAYVHVAKKSWTHNKIKKTDNYYRLYISGDLSVIPCKVTRKKSSKRKQKKNVLVTGISVIPVGVGQYFGFELEEENRMFLLGDFTVAHNTVCAGQIVHDAFHKGKRVIFVVHRQELAKQTDKTLKGYGVTASFIMAGKPADYDNPIQIATIGTLCNRLDVVKEPDLIIIDECFVGNTKVSTSLGEKKIKDVKPGDVVLCATGYGAVLSTSKKRTEEICKIRLTDGTELNTTRNHPFFTERGWVKAGELEKGQKVFSKKNMPSLWGRIPSKQRLLGGDIQKTKVLQRILLEEDVQPNVYRGDKRKNATISVAHKTSAYKTWWQRTLYSATVTHERNVRARMGTRICDTIRRKTAWIPYLLQSRPWESINKNSDRDRWKFPFWKKENIRQEKRRQAGDVRVESVSFFKCGRRKNVYNLEVYGHPSYFANGVLVHNCQHSLANQWLKLKQHFRKSKMIGLTATPCRLDGKPLREYFDTLVIGPSTADLIAKGALTPYDYYAPSRIDTSGMKHNKTDFTADALSFFSQKREIIGDNIQQYQRLANGKRNIVFACNVKHSLEIVKRYQDAGIPAAHLDGETPQADREKILSQFASGEIKVLSNVELFGEGFDLPAIEVVSLLRPTLSTSLYLQQVGRALRPCPELGKERALILDHVGNYERHGMPDDYREWSLKGGLVKKTSAKPTEATVRVQRCPECFFAHSPAHTCPMCGHVYKNECGVKEVAGELVLLGTQEHRDALKKEIKNVESYEELVKIENERGYKMWWAENTWLRMSGEDLRLSITGLTRVAKARGYSRGWAWLQAKRRGRI